MPAPKPVVIKIRGGYKVTIGSYTTKVLIKKGGYNLEPLNVETSFGRKNLATLNGTTSGDRARFSEVFHSEALSKSAGLRALAILMPCTEIVLREAGINTIGVRTHAAFARFLKQMDWKTVGKGETYCDVEKDILKIKPKFLFKIKPLARKTKKKKPPRKPRRRV